MEHTLDILLLLLCLFFLLRALASARARRARGALPSLHEAGNTAFALGAVCYFLSELLDGYRSLRTAALTAFAGCLVVACVQAFQAYRRERDSTT